MAEEALACPNCGRSREAKGEKVGEAPGHVAMKHPKPGSTIAKMKIACVALGVLAALAFILGVSNLVTAHDKIENYSNFGDYSSLNENAYVGGDAYNYIINGTYFTAHSVQGVGYLIISSILGMGSLFLYLRDGSDEDGAHSTSVPSDLPGL